MERSIQGTQMRATRTRNVSKPTSTDTQPYLAPESLLSQKCNLAGIEGVKAALAELHAGVRGRGAVAVHHEALNNLT